MNSYDQSIFDEEPDEGISPEDVEALSRLLMQDDLQGARRFVGQFVERRLPLDVILIDLLTAAAAAVGESWNEDRCSFCDATLVLSRLQYLARVVVADGPRIRRRRRGQLVAISAAPGEQHIFGLVVLEELLHHAGWDVLEETPESLADLLRTRHVEVLAVTACRRDRLDEVTRLVREARRVSRNPDLIVLVGGRCFVDDPELVHQVGATATAPSPTDAVLVVRKLVDSPATLDVRL